MSYLLEGFKMIDLAQADKTLRAKLKASNYYDVVNSEGVIVANYDNQADAIRYALKSIVEYSVIKANY